jgi:hypothetical protein
MRWKFHLPELVSAIHQQINMLFKNPSGKLRTSFQLGNFHAKESEGRSEIMIDNDLPYAAIQNYGGSIPERTAKAGTFMHWVGPGGEDVFAKRAKGFTITGKEYIERGVDQWYDDLDIEWSEK